MTSRERFLRWSLIPAGIDQRARHRVGTVPPSITYSLPWIEAARSDTRNATSSATSSGRGGMDSPEKSQIPVRSSLNLL